MKKALLLRAGPLVFLSRLFSRSFSRSVFVRSSECVPRVTEPGFLSPVFSLAGYLRGEEEEGNFFSLCALVYVAPSRESWPWSRDNRSRAPRWEKF